MIVEIGYGVAAIGVVVSILGMALLSQRIVNYKVVNRMLAKLAEAREVERIRKVCRVAPRSHLGAIEAAIVAGQATKAAGGDVNAAVHQAFDASATTLGGAAAGIIALGLVGVGLELVGVVITFVGHAKVGPQIGLGLFALFIGGMIVARRSMFGAAVVDTRHHILPGVVAGLASSTSDA